MKLLRIFLCPFMCTGLALAESSWPAFEMDWTYAGASAVDLSRYLTGPAGANGPVTIKDGHLALGDGRRWRIWGVNVTGAACYPEKEDAKQVVRHLARFGINCVRFHFLDSNWGTERTLWDPDRQDTQSFSRSQMDKLDFFVAALKEHGIYSNFNLNVGRVYRRDDGVRDYKQISLGKALQYFDTRIQELHEDFARRLLTHRNPYTKSEYRHEPALAIVELVNENSIVESWFSGRLRGEKKGPGGGTWTDITASYAADLTRQYNQWLKRELTPEQLSRLRRTAGVNASETVPRLLPEQFKKADTLRFYSEARFYMSLEDAYFQRMRKLIQVELGTHALLAATSDHNHYKSGTPLLSSASRLDIVDGHVYWQHPKRIQDKVTGKRSFYMANTPMVNDPRHATVVQLARSAVANKPYTVSETNHPFPHPYACEGIPILAAYALFQDWDGIFFYTFAHNDPKDWSSRTPGHFDIGIDPVKMIGLAGAGLMFHRGDVQPARRTIARAYTQEQIIESLLLDAGKHRPMFTPGFAPELCLRHRTTIGAFDRTASPYPPFSAGPEIKSDTEELTWRRRDNKGLVMIDTKQTQALIGFVGKDAPALSHIKAEIETPFCSVFLTSLDDKPIARSQRLLLCTTAGAALTDMTWNAERTGLTKWGRLPMRIEPVIGNVVLRNLQGGALYGVTPLDAHGRASESPVSVTPGDKGVQIELGTPATLWYLIERSSGLKPTQFKSRYQNERRTERERFLIWQGRRSRPSEDGRCSLTQSRSKISHANADSF